ncbi:filamentous hemagglutinin N-terminal domain-containing protein [Morganella morganii]|nr:filamentous hemagglutinin N-terminal domain-containing protein [Morganella morganii]
MKDNITIIDISKPDKNGLSYNKYNQFNVSESGAVLNNGIKESESYLTGNILNAGKVISKGNISIFSDIVTNQGNLAANNNCER